MSQQCLPNGDPSAHTGSFLRDRKTCINFEKTNKSHNPARLRSKAVQGRDSGCTASHPRLYRVDTETVQFFTRLYWV